MFYTTIELKIVKTVHYKIYVEYIPDKVSRGEIEMLDIELNKIINDKVNNIFDDKLNKRIARYSIYEEDKVILEENIDYTNYQTEDQLICRSRKLIDNLQYQRFFIYDIWQWTEFKFFRGSRVPWARFFDPSWRDFNGDYNPISMCIAILTSELIQVIDRLLKILGNQLDDVNINDKEKGRTTCKDNGNSRDISEGMCKKSIVWI